MNGTENKFKNYCDKKNYFCRKLQTHTATGHGSKQVGDFYVANNNGIYFVECKQRIGKDFKLNELTQLSDLLLLRRKSNKANIYILINFYSYNKLAFMPFEVYLEIVKNLKFKNGKPKKSLNMIDIPYKYQCNWKTLDF